MVWNFSAVAYKTTQNKARGHDKVRLFMLYGADVCFMVPSEFCTDMSMKKKPRGLTFREREKNTLKRQSHVRLLTYL